ncbi:gene transfer agent family protein [Phyllobacterium zundukense]|uniref:Gene transfer agent family protein n=1 Tax=Phyllobacterium zundukense TaxID=1867719 RepID=A0A2N9W446_9HYPH|nr:gene transfer agent family protein [Phyllobacterium zundukense]ATU92015.1 hypothetical protein BLM14_10510 [Phyllobacterium zundukense]PIO46514.1 hypothetical protein B5P45_01565 [Phyllobacterium zundukense]
MNKHVAFFGDAEHAFTLTPEMVFELERKTGVGIGAFYKRVFAFEFHFADLLETIRLGLIGGGTSPSEAHSLIETYAKPTPIEELIPLAFTLLENVWTGRKEAPATIPQDEIGQTEVSAESAIDDALVQVPA